MSRLVFRKHYAVAIQVAKHLKLPESWILEHWAYHKVMNDQSKMINMNYSISYSYLFFCFQMIMRWLER